MNQTLRRFLLTFILLVGSSSFLLASSSEEEKKESPIDIMGTVADHDYFAFHIFTLPRIILWENAHHEKQLSFFKNTESAVESGLFIEEGHSIHPADEGHILIDFSITSHLVWFWIGMVLTVTLTLAMAKRYKKGIGSKVEPKGILHNLFEALFLFVRDIAHENINKHKADKYVPYLFTVFMGISFMNLFGLLPWSATATADITVTAVFAVFTFILTQAGGTKDYWAHIFWFPGVPLPIKLLMIPVELMGIFTKPFALAIRLFANMMSGKIMIIAIIGLIFIFNQMYGHVAAYGVSVFSVLMTSILYILKAFVALLQAYIFTLLSSVFIGIAADNSHEAEHVIE